MKTMTGKRYGKKITANKKRKLITKYNLKNYMKNKNINTRIGTEAFEEIEKYIMEYADILK
jgi:hypothetical protein